MSGAGGPTGGGGATGTGGTVGMGGRGTAPGAVRIMLVDDHPVVREGYKRLLERRPGYSVVAEASDARAAYSAYRDSQPDITIMDVTLPGSSGIEALRHIRQYDRAARIVVFTMHQGAAFAMKAIQAGACGYVTKSSEPQELIHAIDAALAGRTSISADVMEALALERLDGAERLDHLSPRQMEILRLVALGRTTQEIATELSISAKTVQNNHYRIRSELGVRTDAELVWFAIRRGMISPQNAEPPPHRDRGE